MNLKQIIKEIKNNDFKTLLNKYSSNNELNQYESIQLKKCGGNGLYTIHYLKDTSNDYATKIIVKYVYFSIENGKNEISYIRLINTHSYFNGKIIMPNEIKCLSL